MNTSHLPPDGTYSPRILAPEASIWLQDGETHDMSGKSVIFRRAGKNFYAAPHANAKATPMFNGEPLLIECPLKDGDFIHCGKERYLFQADPVADWRKLLELEPDEEQSYKPTPLLEDSVIFRRDGLSIDGGMTFVRWDEIVSVVTKDGFKNSVELKTRAGTQKLVLSRSASEKREFTNGILRHCPFQLSASLSDYQLMDAYSFVIDLKRLHPVDYDSKRLPASLDFMQALDIPKGRQAADMRRLILAALIVLPVCGAPLSVMTGEYEEIIPAFRFYFLYVLVIIGTHLFIHQLFKLPLFILRLFRKSS